MTQPSSNIRPIRQTFSSERQIVRYANNVIILFDEDDGIAFSANKSLLKSGEYENTLVGRALGRVDVPHEGFHTCTHTRMNVREVPRCTYVRLRFSDDARRESPWRGTTH